MQAERLTAKRRHLLHPTLDVHAASSWRDTALMADHRDLTRPVVHVVKLERHERHAPTPGHDAGYRNRFVVVASGLVLQLRNVNGTERAPGERKRADEREHETRSLGHLFNSQPPTSNFQPSCVGIGSWHLEVQKSRDRIVKQLPECGDASACLM